MIGEIESGLTKSSYPWALRSPRTGTRLCLILRSHLQNHHIQWAPDYQPAGENILEQLSVGCSLLRASPEERSAEALSNKPLPYLIPEATVARSMDCTQVSPSTKHVTLHKLPLEAAVHSLAEMSNDDLIFPRCMFLLSMPELQGQSKNCSLSRIRTQTSKWIKSFTMMGVENSSPLACTSWTKNQKETKTITLHVKKLASRSVGW